MPVVAAARFVVSDIGDILSPKKAPETIACLLYTSQVVTWLWYPFISYGKLTIVQGDPGDGKTTLVLNIAAKLSKGEA